MERKVNVDYVKKLAFSMGSLLCNGGLSGINFFL